MQQSGFQFSAALQPQSGSPQINLSQNPASQTQLGGADVALRMQAAQMAGPLLRLDTYGEKAVKLSVTPADYLKQFNTILTEVGSMKYNSKLKDGPGYIGALLHAKNIDKLVRAIQDRKITSNMTPDQVRTLLQIEKPKYQRNTDANGIATVQSSSTGTDSSDSQEDIAALARQIIAIANRMIVLGTTNGAIGTSTSNTEDESGGAEPLAAQSQVASASQGPISWNGTSQISMSGGGGQSAISFQPNLPPAPMTPNPNLTNSNISNVNFANSNLTVPSTNMINAAANAAMNGTNLEVKKVVMPVTGQKIYLYADGVKNNTPATVVKADESGIQITFDGINFLTLESYNPISGNPTWRIKGHNASHYLTTY